MNTTHRPDRQGRLTMPIHYSRDEVKRRITVVATGAIAPEDVLAFVEAQHAAGAWSDSVLIDATAITATRISAADSHQIAARVATLSRETPRGPVALVAIDLTVFGMNRMYGTLLENKDVAFRVFREFPAAEEWLQSRTHLQPTSESAP